MLRAVAMYRGQSRAGLFRTWVRDAYNRLPEEARMGFVEADIECR